MSEKEKKEIVEYGLYRLKIIIASIIVTLSIGYTLDFFVQSISFLASFLPLRRYAGGYHAKTQRRCFLISFLTIYISFWGLKMINSTRVTVTLILIVNMICSSIIWQLAPIENENKNLSEEEIIRYKTYTRKILLIENIIFIILYMIGAYKIFFGGFASTIITVLVVVAGAVKNERTNKCKITL